VTTADPSAIFKVVLPSELVNNVPSSVYYDDIATLALISAIILAIASTIAFIIAYADAIAYADISACIDAAIDYDYIAAAVAIVIAVF